MQNYPTVASIKELKPVAKSNDAGMDMKNEHANHNQSDMAQNTTETQNAAIKAVFDNYFSVKDALVKTMQVLLLQKL
jgi:hypothetical protein